VGAPARRRAGAGTGAERRLTLVAPGLQFALCAVRIAVAGTVLCASAGRIALATGLSGGWVGTGG